jgi:uncharacterized cupin superfamily protein
MLLARSPEEHAMHRPILNIDELEYRTVGNGDRIDARIGQISLRVGAQKLGYNLTVLAPGKRAFPFHSHRVNEEMVLVLEGEGVVRLGAEEHRIRRGDVIAHPPGGPETAHQIINTSSAELKYLAVSTKQYPEVAEYPDSKKFGVLAETRGPDGMPQVSRFIGRWEGSLDYFDGEK